MYAREQFHGYRNGHQLLQGNVELIQQDQDTVDRLSDISGQLRPGEEFAPYFTFYPLPSQTYYVVALTRQDLAAPRAGCVRTHSLFVPMPEWTAPTVLQTLRDVVSHFQLSADSNVLGHPSGAEEIRTWPRLESPWSLELVEAMFLEKRAPIAVFDAKDADLACFRLIAALWPALRKMFAVCTFSLGPRSVQGRPFDIVFAPKAARSRFSDWSGRRIEPSSTPYRPRHRWSNALAEAVFKDFPPNLDRLDELGILGGHQDASESRLRLSLFWRELADKSAESPEAVLGLIDIYTTAHPTSLRARESLANEIRVGVSTARRSFSDSQFWQYLLALTQKFEKGRLPKGTASVVRAAARARAANAPLACVSAFQESMTEGATLPAPLASAIGEGVSQATENDAEVLATLSAFPGRIGSQIISRSRVLANRLVFAAGNDSELLSGLHNLLQSADSKTRQSLLLRSALSFTRASQAGLLDSLLRGTSSSTLLFAVQAIGNATSFDVPQFDEPLVSAAHATHSILNLRKVVGLHESEGADRLLATTLTIQSEDVRWLSQSISEPQRKARVLAELIHVSSDHQIKQLVENASADFDLLATLAVDSLTYALPMTRLLGLASVSDEQLSSYGSSLLRQLSPEDTAYRPLALHVISRLQGNSELLDDRALLQTVETLVATGSGREAIDSLFSGRTSDTAVSRALYAYDLGSQRFKSQLHSRIDLVTGRILQSGLAGLSKPDFRTIAEMLNRSGDSNRRGQAVACGRVLDQCFASPHLPVGDLVVAAFPIVYREVRSGSPGFNLLDLLFTDWDHCKTIRRKLVETYIRSAWPPVGVLICAWRAHDVDRVLRSLQKAWRGREYLKSIQESLSQYEGPDKELLSRALRSFVAIESIDAEDD
ncbi:MULTISPECIES: hypothetical protein [Hydrocarboniphaga]|nr:MULTISPECIES: hypothetical protein [Hydrocarboniphaga]MDZ4079750.1 hypothetical protein [Hydrocarboniphaga sp.]